MTVCWFACDLENIFGGVMVCGENVGRSSQSRRVVTNRQNRDRWCRFMTICQFAIFMAVLWSGVKMSVVGDGLSRP